MTFPSAHPFPTRSAGRLLAWVARLPELFIDGLAGQSCAACDASLRAHTVFCPGCASAVEPFAGPTAGVVPLHAYGAFGGPLADAIRRFKYGARPDLARPLGELLRHAAAPLRSSLQLIVPVPLHPARLAERGFNQAALLAARLRVDLDAPLAPTALLRQRNTPPQAGLDARRRADNLRGAFTVPDPGRIRDRRILLVDDVITTGTTARACADALYRAGAGAVLAIAVARVE